MTMDRAGAAFGVGTAEPVVTWKRNDLKFHDSTKHGKRKRL